MSSYKNEINQETFERIENYLMNTMNASDKLLLEQEMERDEWLRNEVALQRQLLAAAEVNTFFSERKPAQAAIKNFSYKWLYAAASLVAIFLAIWWFQGSSTQDPEQLYANYFRPDPGMPVVMSSTDEYVFYDGMVSYKEGDYKKAVSIWEKLASVQGCSDTLHYYTGAALMNDNQPEKAVTSFTLVANDQKSVWKDRSVWYMALCYLQIKNIPAAKSWLIKLPGDERAKQLLIDLNKISPK